MSNDLPEDLTDAIKQSALEPKQVTGDQGSITQQNIKDMIAVDKYLASKDAAKGSKRKNTLRGLFTKIAPPGSRG